MKPSKEPSARFQLILQWGGTLLVLLFIFGWLLPRFISYEDVWGAIQTLTFFQLSVLFFFAALRSLTQSGVYTAVIPGLGFWPGWKAYEASSSVASFAPAGVDLAVRYGMYRSFGVSGDKAGAGFILSGIFTIGIKFVLPVIALGMILFAGDYPQRIAILAIIAVAVGLGSLAVIMIRRESLSRLVGDYFGAWYNRLLAGRWRFVEIEDTGQKTVDYRNRIVDTLGDVWKAATLSQIGAEAASFAVLVFALRFMGVGSSDADLALIFVAYALGLIASLMPFVPQGLGAVELVYVVVIAGETGTDLADLVMAAAFTHRVFTWLLPIIVGMMPLIQWRRKHITVDDGAGPLPD